MGGFGARFTLVSSSTLKKPLLGNATRGNVANPGLSPSCSINARRTTWACRNCSVSSLSKLSSKLLDFPWLIKADHGLAQVDFLVRYSAERCARLNSLMSSSMSVAQLWISLASPLPLVTKSCNSFLGKIPGLDLRAIDVQVSQTLPLAHQIISGLSRTYRIGCRPSPTLHGWP